MADPVATGETNSSAATTTSTKAVAARNVRFSDKLEVIYPDEVKEKAQVVKGAGRRRHVSRRERRNDASGQSKVQEDAQIRLHKNFEYIKRFADELTPQKLATEVQHYVSGTMEELGIKEEISGVPNNGQVLLSPMSYCSDCVKTIASFFSGENVAKNILKNDDGVEEQVYITDVKKLATLFLSAQKLHFYDHVTVEAFNDNAMRKGGPLYDMPLSMACLADSTENGCGSGNLYEKLAGKETVCAAFSTGLVMQCETSELTALSENNFKTHNQLLKENVDLNTIRSGCACLKSDEWLMRRATEERKAERQFEENGMSNKAEKNCSWGDDDVSSFGGESEQEETKEKKKNEVEEKKEEESEEEEENEEEEEVDSDEKEEEEKAKKVSEAEEKGDSDHKCQQLEDVDDRDFRPGYLVQPVEKEEDFDRESWSHMRTTSSCLALCRHVPSCVVNTINKTRVLKSLLLVRLPKGEKEGIASTTPGEHFTVIAHPENFLIFSLGSTVYEALAYQCGDGNPWDSASTPSAESSEKAIAKVYTTVHTVAAPFFRSGPVCHINQQNKYGYYKTFRIPLPGNFSGYYNDASIDWRSLLYFCATTSAIQAECRGAKKSHYSLLEDDIEIAPWPRRKPVRIEGGIVYDDSGDMSGNYLTPVGDGFFVIGGDSAKEEKAAVTAHATVKNLTAVIKIIEKSIGELLTGNFKKQLVELKTLDIERTQREEAAATGAAAERGGREGLTAHETQHLNDLRTNMAENARFTAQTIKKYEKCLTSLERDLGMMNKYLSYNLKGYTVAAAAASSSHQSDIDDNVYAYYP